MYRVQEETKDGKIDIINYVGNLDRAVIEVMEQRRLHNAQRVFEAVGTTVQYGLLRGYELVPPFFWGRGDVATQVLGLYEQEVCALLSYLSGKRRVFLDLGAANGYYGVGLVSVKRFDRSVCFELDPAAADALSHNAIRLGIREKIDIFGAAGSDFVEKISSVAVDLSQAVALIDIEGAEFDILTNENLEKLRNTPLIIENHDFMRPERYEASRLFVDRARAFFHVAEVKGGPRDLRQIPMLADGWNDHDRWLLCSESRAKLGSWFVLTPISDVPITEQLANTILTGYQATLVC